MSLSRAQNIFMPANINSIVIFNLVFFFLVEEVGPWERSWFMSRSDVISFGGLKLEMLAL